MREYTKRKFPDILIQKQRLFDAVESGITDPKIIGNMGVSESCINIYWFSALRKFRPSIHKELPMFRN